MRLNRPILKDTNKILLIYVLFVLEVFIIYFGRLRNVIGFFGKEMSNEILININSKYY